jgi:hypothetical protein
MAKKYRNSSVPRTKRVYNDEDKTIVDTRVPNLNGVREYVQPVHNAKDKTSVCKYCSKNLVRGYICYDCRELEAPVKRTSIEERLAIEEGLKLLAEIRANESVIRQDDMANNTIAKASVLETIDNFCKSCGINIAPDLQGCEFCK